MITLFVSNPEDKDLQFAASVIKKGGLVAFPTETVYGLGANALLPDAAKKIYEAKNRPSDNPLIIHLDDYRKAEKYCFVNDGFYKLAETFMPGPITVVLKKKKMIPDTVTGGLDTVAVRVPSNPVANSFLKYCDVPVAAPSANLSGRPSCTTASHVFEDMNGRIDMIIDGGDCDIGIESTIVAPVRGCVLNLLRPGKITVEDLTRAGFKVNIDKAVTERLSENEKPLAPGMKYRHYAPNAVLVLIEGDDSSVEAFMKEKLGSDDTAVIGFDEYVSIRNDPDFYSLGSRIDSMAHAHRLFDLLRSFDKNEKIKTIYAKMPSKEGVDFAVFNRMIKAAGYTIIHV